MDGAFISWVGVYRGGRALRYLPHRFDEIIILPLPFVDRLIVQAYTQNPAAARQTLAYLSDSTNQQQLAALAMGGIAATMLGRCHTVGDITAIGQELAWIPNPPPASLGPIVPQFLEISQGVGAAQQASSPYRHRELLQPPLSKLRHLKESLIFGQNPRLTTEFGTAVEQWLTILETAHRTLAEQSNLSAEIPQCYVAGPALDPNNARSRFKGRQDLFRDIEGLLLSDPPPVLLLYGGRRTGKTSALKYLNQQLGPDLIPLLIDIQGAASATTLSGLAQNLANQMINTARQTRNLHLPAPNVDDLKRDPFPALQTWFERIEKTAPGKRFLLCLDEFERLSEVVEATNSRAPLNFLRHLLQHRQQWHLLFSSAHTLAELPTYWSDYLINSRTLRVSYLKKEEARDLILNPIPDFPPIYPPSVVDEIVRLSRCQPFLVQLLCFSLVEHLNQHHRTQSTLNDIPAIIPKALAEGGMYFRELWQSTLTPPEQQLLQALLNGHTLTQFPGALFQSLIEKEILEKTPTGYDFQVPLVKRFISDTIKPMGAGA